MKTNFITVEAICCQNGKKSVATQNIIKEESLLIKADGFSQTVIRTPGDDINLAAGICFIQKIIETPSQILSTKFYLNMQPNKLIIKISDKKEKQIQPLKVKSDFKIGIKDAVKCVEKLLASQILRHKTGSAHAAMLFDYNLNTSAFAEDVGRHNAFDKAIGEVFMENNLNRLYIAALSSRINYDIITKAIRAAIPVVIGAGKPTSKAVDAALSYNISIAWAGKKGDFFIFTGEDQFH